MIHSKVAAHQLTANVIKKAVAVRRAMTVLRTAAGNRAVSLNKVHVLLIVYSVIVDFAVAP